MQPGMAVAMLCAGAVAIALSAQRLACCVAPKGTAGSSKGCGKARCRCGEGPAGSLCKHVTCRTFLLVSLDNACNAHKQCPKLCLPALRDMIDDQMLVCPGTSLQISVFRSR